MIELFTVGFILLFALFLIVLICLNINIMVNKGKTYNDAEVNPEILELVKLGEGLSSYPLSASTRGETKTNFRFALKDIQEKWKESVPNHKTRVSLRKKRKKKEK